MDYKNKNWENPEIYELADDYTTEEFSRPVCAPVQFCNPRVSCMPHCFPRQVCAPRQSCNPRVSCMPLCFPRRMCAPRPCMPI